MAVMGPDVPHQTISGTTVTQSQIAATVAAALLPDYPAAAPKARAVAGLQKAKY
ncbi:MAG: hypothetical protein U0936_22830 [Planctomycetaceae bacterium]